MTALLAFLAMFVTVYLVVGYLTLRACFWIVDRRES